MRITILIISILFSSVGFGQTAIPMNEEQPFDSIVKKFDGIKAKQEVQKVDSMDLKVISMKEFKAYMERIDLIIQKQFDLTKASRAKYEQIINVMNSVYAEADKKRRK